MLAWLTSGLEAGVGAVVGWGWGGGAMDGSDEEEGASGGGSRTDAEAVPRSCTTSVATEQSVNVV